MAPGVTKADVRDGGIVGVYFRPSGDGRFPAVMTFGGSGGGLMGADTTAALLASHGFASLAIAYFAMPGLPLGLRSIPLEYLRTGITWLLARDEVAGPHAGVLGTSRGGELALLLGATFEEVGAVVSRAPSHVVWAGFGPGSDGDTPSWTHHGEPVPWMHEDDRNRDAWAAVNASRPVALTPGFLAELEDDDAVAAAEIAVERTNGPILLVSGEDDAMWPSSRMGELAEKRAADNGFDRIVHLRYAGAGHGCGREPGLPTMLQSVHPVDGELYAFGGTAKGNADAQADSWQRTLSFLREAL